MSQALEELKLKQMQELQQLQLMHQKQMHEQQLRLAAAAAGAAAGPAAGPLAGAARLLPGGPAPPSNAPPPPPPSGLKAALNASPSQQIKITRTASGGVEFTPVTVDGSGAKPPAASSSFRFISCTI